MGSGTEQYFASEAPLELSPALEAKSGTYNAQHQEKSLPFLNQSFQRPHEAICQKPDCLSLHNPTMSNPPAAELSQEPQLAINNPDVPKTRKAFVPLGIQHPDFLSLQS